MRALRLSLLVILLAECGCSSLRPPDPPPLSAACESNETDEVGVGWYALGTVLEVLGPFLSGCR